jgi:hypothetical protein
LRLILYYYIKERFIYFFPLTIFSKYIAFHSYWVNWVCIHWNEMYKTKCNRCASVFIHRKWNVQNEVPSGAFFSVHSPEMKCTKPSYRCLHLRRNTLKKNTLFIPTQGLDRSKQLSQFTFKGQNFLFWLTPWHGAGTFLTPCTTGSLLELIHDTVK